jgi:PAS domain S-box-containing protein
VVITDIRMPGMDGIDVLKRIKEQDPDKEVIVVTGFGQLEMAIRALRLNASDFITKPINHDALLVALQRAKARYMSRKELQESEGKYGTLVENSLTGIYIDQDGRVQFANKKFAEIYGYAKDELMGMEAWRLVHPEYRAMTDETRAKRLRGEETLPQYEAKGLRKDGETIWIVRRNTRIEYRGRPAILGNIVDITSRKRAEEALRKARDELEQRVKVRTATGRRRIKEKRNKVSPIV